MHLLPPNLAKLADVAQDKGSRFALGSVRLKLGDGTFTAEATDTKVAVRVEGNAVAPADEFPPDPAFDAVPNGHADGLVPSAVWKKAFTTGAKLTGRAHPAALRSVAVKLGESRVTFSATDGTGRMLEQSETNSGSFPPFDSIIPAAGGPTRFALDARLLLKLCQVLIAVAPGDGDVARVEFDVYDEHKPIRFTRQTPGVKVSGVVMPLSD